MSGKPVCVSDFEQCAERVLPKAVYDYYRSGADNQQTLADNVAAFSRWRLYPRMLRDVSVVDLSTSIFGQKISMPICVGATAMQRMAHVDGETATARACRSVGTGMMLSSWATSTIEEVAQAAPDGLHWLQLYIYKDREVTRSLVQRAERAGYKGIFVTVDTPFLGKRFDDVRNRFQLPPHLRMKNFDTNDLAFSSEKGYGENSGLAVYVAQAIDPSIKWEDIQWLRRLTSLPIVAKGILRGLYRMKNFDTNDLAFSSEKGYGENSGLAVYVAQAIDPSIKWEDIQWLRRLTSLPIVAKGILRGLYRMKNFDTNDLAFSSEKGYGENSGLAVYVAQAIDPSIKWEDIQWLRRLTSLPIVAKGILRGLYRERRACFAIDVLPEIVEAVEGKVEVFLDGGVRKGTDVLKALALGARAVFIGRPIIWGLVYQGEEGAKEVLQMLKEEFQLAMALSGCRSVKEIDRTLVQTTSAVAKI
nr:hydroxyacid oxidase 1 [Pelodiscus sinensis]|eukprot:XP_014435507.1 hydroxyacid oxidase 1 [Pelodiscus sinensis]